MHDGHLCLASPFAPSAPFRAGNAIGRNKIIYALSQVTLVAAAAKGSDGTWALVLEERSDGTTRLVARARGRGRPAFLFRLIGPFITDPGHVLMQRRQLAGIKQRVEAAAGAPRP